MVAMLKKSIYSVVAVVLVSVFVVGCGGSKKVAPITEEEAPINVISEPEAAPVQPIEPESKPMVIEDTTPKRPFSVQTIHFDFDKYNLTSDAVQILAENAESLHEYPEARITIEGHCDERGTVAYNLALGDKRARAAKDYLVSLGVNPSRITTISYGKERPVDMRSNEEAWAKNRRAEFVKR